MNGMRIAFATGTDGWFQKEKLVAKYLKMRLEGVIYPDVFALPYLLGGTCDFLNDGQSIPAGKYDLVMSELNGSQSQLQYLLSLVTKRVPPVAVIHGPPEILSRELTHNKLLLVRRILSEAAYVWAYSETVREFCDGLIGRPKARVIPWPFDTVATIRIAAKRWLRPSDTCRVLLNAPLRFCFNTQNFPFVLKAALLNVWDELPQEFRKRVTFHSFVYNQDVEQFHATGFAEGLPIRLEPKKQYCSFVRFVGGCDAVINILFGNVLGRITFLAAALGKPGIFSGECELNRALYPGTTISLLNSKLLTQMLRALLSGLASGAVDTCFLPSAEAVARIGDFEANSRELQQMVKEGGPCFAMTDAGSGSLP